jgi:hypothetical protein
VLGLGYNMQNLGPDLREPHQLCTGNAQNWLSGGNQISTVLTLP